MTPPASEPSAATSAQLTAFYGLCFAVAAADGDLDRDEITKLYEFVDSSRLCAEDRAPILSPRFLEEMRHVLSAQRHLTGQASTRLEDLSQRVERLETSIELTRERMDVPERL